MHCWYCYYDNCGEDRVPFVGTCLHPESNKPTFWDEDITKCFLSDSILDWCVENQCGKFKTECNGTSHPAMCPLMDNSDSEIEL
jgi:hypothetical protein